MNSDFDRFLQQFEVVPPACAPVLPELPAKRRIRLLSLIDLVRAVGQRVGRFLAFAYVLVFWSVVAAIILLTLAALVLQLTSMKTHELYDGETGIGKSNAIRLRTRADLVRPDTSVVVVGSQPNTISWELYGDAVALGQAHRTVLEDYDRSDDVIPRDLLPPSKKTGWQGFEEDRRTIEFLLDAAGRRRGFRNLDKHPLILDLAEPLCSLMMHQQPRKPLAAGAAAFHPGTSGFRQLLSECTNEQAAATFYALPRHPSTLERVAAPAKRFLSIFFRSPVLCMRDAPGQGVSLAEMLDRGYHYFIQGGHSMSQEEFRFISATVGLDVIAYKQSGGKQKVILILEESEANDAVGSHEARAIQLLGKTGLSVRIAAQEPFWENQNITQIVLQNTNHVWMGNSAEHVAEMAARDLSGIIDPYAVKSVEHDVRSIPVGWEQVPVETETNLHSGGRNHSVTIRERPVYHYELRSHIVHFSPAEQIALLKKWNLNLAVGEALTKVDGKVRFVRFPLADELMPQDHIHRYYEEHRKLWPFVQAPGFEAMAPSTGDAATTPRSFTFKIRRHAGKRSEPASTPLQRWQRDEAGGSPDENEDDDCDTPGVFT